MEYNIIESAPDHWEKTTLGAVASKIQTGPFGSQLHASDYVESGIPCIMPKNIINGAVDTLDIAKITAEDAERLSKHKVKLGDIIYSRRGDVEKCALIREDQEGWLCGTGCLKVSFVDTESSINSRYIAYFLSHPEIKAWIVAHAVGATMPNLNTSILSEVPFLLPPLQTQETIASTLGSIDDKIAINQQINQTLEAMAQGVFKSWFVDFEPTRAKMAALEAGGTAEDATLAAMSAISSQPREALTTLKTTNPESYADLHTTASLFPSRLRESELGEIPEGWEVGNINSVLELAYGKALKKTDRIEGEFPVYGSGGVNGSHDEAIVNGPGIIVGRKGTVGSIYWEYRDFFPIDTVFYVIPKSGFSLTYCYQLLKTQGLENMNTDAAVPGLNRNNVYRLDVILPPSDIIKTFNSSINLLYKEISVLTEQSQTLSQLRDSLLPKLLSGEISVDAAQNQKETV